MLTPAEAPKQIWAASAKAAKTISAGTPNSSATTNLTKPQMPALDVPNLRPNHLMVDHEPVARQQSDATQSLIQQLLSAIQDHLKLPESSRTALEQTTSGVTTIPDSDETACPPRGSQLECKTIREM